MTSYRIIDCHLHSGVQNVNWGWETIRGRLFAAGISGAGVIPPVEDIYDRYNPRFTDTPAWQACRRRAHQYLLDLRERGGGGEFEGRAGELISPGPPLNPPHLDIYPYFFVWNDFAWEDLGPEFVAIKWHRHPDEPEYRYDDPRCREFLEVVRERGLPILLEESFPNTLFFLEHLAPDLPVIIPHLGALSGGYRPLRQAGVFAQPHIYADMAVAGPADIDDYLSRYGSHRLLFGSDYPFSLPQTELDKILRLNLPEEQARAVLGDNFRRLCRLTD